MNCVVAAVLLRPLFGRRQHMICGALETGHEDCAAGGLQG
jgi:hypothetical protein